MARGQRAPSRKGPLKEGRRCVGVSQALARNEARTASRVWGRRAPTHGSCQAGLGQTQPRRRPGARRRREPRVASGPPGCPQTPGPSFPPSLGTHPALGSRPRRRLFLPQPEGREGTTSILLPESKLFKGTPAEPSALTRPVRSEGHLSPERGDTPAAERRT